MKKKPCRGYLVVLADIGTDLNPQYRGIDRMPPYYLPPYPHDYEAEAMDRYTFGGFQDEDTGLIPSHESSNAVLRLFRDSPRKHEIIFCDLITPSVRHSLHGTHTLLGTDVAVVTPPFYSVVGDFPSDGAMKRYFEMLNSFGLFGSISEAAEFLVEYRRRELPDWDSQYGLFDVYEPNNSIIGAAARSPT